MARKEILDRIEKYVHPFRISKGKGFRLKDFDPGDTCGLTLDKGEAADLLQRGTEWLAEEQDTLRPESLVAAARLPRRGHANRTCLVRGTANGRGESDGPKRPSSRGPRLAVSLAASRVGTAGKRQERELTFTGAGSIGT
jgi:hypothetical protein